MTRPINENFPKLSQIINNFEDCPLKNSGVLPVHPVGNGKSGLMLIGEAPGAKEDEIGEPFVGASGKLLNNLLLPSLDLTRENIYLTNIVKCRPPKNRDPKPEEKEAWGKILREEILTVKPKVIATLGRHSLSFFWPDVKISEVHGKANKLTFEKDFECVLIPLYHPAVALYNPKQKEVLLKDFQIIKKYL